MYRLTNYMLNDQKQECDAVCASETCKFLFFSSSFHLSIVYFGKEQK